MRRLLLMLMVAAMLLTGCNAKKEAVKELDRVMKISEVVLRHMIIRKEL